jgi:hypothetical protein
MYHAIGIMNVTFITIASNSFKGEIHIAKERFRNVVTLEFQERDNNKKYALEYSINSIEPVDALLGGHISLGVTQQKVTTISFSLPDHLMVP